MNPIEENAKYYSSSTMELWHAYVKVWLVWFVSDNKKALEHLPGLRPKKSRYVEVALSLLIKHWIGASLGPGC